MNWVDVRLIHRGLLLCSNFSTILYIPSRCGFDSAKGPELVTWRYWGYALVPSENELKMIWTTARSIYLKHLCLNLFHFGKGLLTWSIHLDKFANTFFGIVSHDPAQSSDPRLTSLVSYLRKWDKEGCWNWLYLGIWNELLLTWSMYEPRQGILES